MKDLVSDLRKKPEHIRKRIAIGSSAGVTALVAIIWAATLSTNGTFALTSQPTPDSSGEDAYVLGGTGVKSNFSQLLGAVGAAAGATTSPASLTIIDGETTSTFDAPPPSNASATVIPF
jgi:hypothetical protein